MLGWATAAATAVVAATGVWLYRYYVPTVAAGQPIGASHVQPADWVRFAHRWSGRVLIGLAVLWVVLAVMRLVRRVVAANTVAFVLSFLGMVAVLAAQVSGWLLPWDQLALWAVTVGDDMRGYRFLWRDDIRFVVLGHREIGLDQLQRAFLVHAVAIPLLLVLVALGYVWFGRRARRGEDDEVDQVASATGSSSSTPLDAAASAWRA